MGAKGVLLSYRSCRAVLASLALLAAALPALGAPVSGQVVDADTGGPLVAARVSVQTYDDSGRLLDQWCEGETDNKGAFKVDSPLAVFGYSGSLGSALGDIALGLFRRGMAVSAGPIIDQGGWTQLPSIHRLDCHSYYMWLGIPVQGYEDMHVFTQMIHVRVEKEGCKPYDGWQFPYDYTPTFAMGIWGKKQGSARLDTVRLVREGKDGESSADPVYLSLSELQVSPTEVGAGGAVSISVKQTPAPGQKKVGGAVIAVVQAATGAVKVELKDSGRAPDRTAGDNVFAGELKLSPQSFPAGNYTIYVLATGMPFGKRTMHVGEEWWRTKSPELASRNILTAQITVQPAD